MAHGGVGAPLITQVDAVRMADSTTTTQYLRTGISSFGSKCDDGRGGTWGQICLKAGNSPAVGTGGYSDFPQFSSYSYTGGYVCDPTCRNPGLDNWAASSDNYYTGVCDSTHFFSIFVN